jgi:hypothetical protein
MWQQCYQINLRFRFPIFLFHIWRALVNTVMNFWVPWSAENFLSSLGRFSLSGKTLFHGVICLFIYLFVSVRKMLIQSNERTNPQRATSRPQDKQNGSDRMWVKKINKGIPKNKKQRVCRAVMFTHITLCRKTVGNAAICPRGSLLKM